MEVYPPTVTNIDGVSGQLRDLAMITGEKPTRLVQESNIAYCGSVVENIKGATIQHHSTRRQLVNKTFHVEFCQILTYTPNSIHQDLDNFQNAYSCWPRN